MIRTRILNVIAVAVLAALLAPALIAPSTASAARTPASRVTIVLAPYLTFADIRDGRVPAIARLAEEGALAAVNVHGSDDPNERGSIARGVLSLSAGAFATAEPAAPSAFGLGERYQDERASDYYERTTGWESTGTTLFLGLPRTQRTNDEADARVEPGTLGQAIVRAGGTTIALGNSDTGYGEDAGRERPAAIAAMDSRGRVYHGDVTSRVLASDDEAPYGVRTDLDRLRGAYQQAIAEADGRRSLVVIDPGDTERAARFAAVATAEVAEQRRQQALATVDEVVEIALADLPKDGMLVVLSPIAPRTATGGVGFAPLVVYGRGFHGVLASSSTHRAGLTTLLDVSATVLAEMGVGRPVQMLGNPLSAQPRDGGLDMQIASIERMDAIAVAIDSAKGVVLNVFILGAVMLLALCTALLLRLPKIGATRARQLADAATALLLLALSVPLAGTLMFALPGAPRGPADAIALLLATAAVLWIVWMLLRRIGRPRVALAVACLAMTAAVIVDQWLGAPMSVSGFFSYSPLLGARYYGLGNEGASLLIGSCLTGLALLFDEFAEADWVAHARRWLLPVLAAAIIVTAAAPRLGANVGVVAWGTAAFAVTGVQMNGRRLSWRTFVLIGAIIGLLVVAFSTIDLGGPASAQTHLARALDAAESDGPAQLVEIVARKAAMSARIFASSSWSYLLVAVLAFLAYVRWRPRGAFADVLAANPHFAAALTGGLVASGVSLVTEDSGIVMPALIMLYVGNAVLFLMLERGAAE